MFEIATAFAMGPQPGGAAGEANLFTSLTPFILIFGVFYFMLIRPQQKKAKVHREMLASLKKGDAIITAGGLYGRIVDTHDDVVVVDLGDTTVTMGRGYISGVPAGNQNVPASREPKKGAKGKSGKNNAGKALPAETLADAPQEESDASGQEPSAAPVETPPAVSVVEDAVKKDNDPVVK